MDVKSSTLCSGDGRIVLRSHGSEAIFSELSSTYPLKLLSPRVVYDNVAVVYVLTYGGGLVGGDRIQLSVDIGPATRLVMLTQGSTKVFKTRPGQRRAEAGATASDTSRITTTQTMDVHISSQSALFLLPDPVTCFRSASYTQKQIFRLSGDASVVVLDWVTSGRKSLGEEWVFSRYYSRNEIWIDGKRVARDALLLEECTDDEGRLPRRTIGARLSPYACYATAVLYGPLVQATANQLMETYETISVYKQGAPADLVWSLSLIDGHGGAGHVLRVAGKETEYVKNWLGQALSTLEDIIGRDIYRKAFS